jgi:hypothetical protein
MDQEVPAVVDPKSVRRPENPPGDQELFLHRFLKDLGIEPVANGVGLDYEDIRTIYQQTSLNPSLNQGQLKAVGSWSSQKD